MADAPWKVMERAVASGFSNWITGGRCDHVLARQALQGRMVERLHGDLAPHPKLPKKWKLQAQWFMQTFHVDAKNRKEFRLGSLLTSPSHSFWSWWAKISHEAAQAGGKRRFMVLMVQPSKEKVVIVGEPERQWLISKCGWVLCPNLQLAGASPKGDDGTETVTICEFYAFLKWLDPAALGCPVLVEE